ncbi:hypothetical protein [Reichenbachiella sp.]|uniref:hypothetical protein n=1 Tax=Reichenbachiella sp. TaxID=2184521 RepID=UPI003B5C3DF7
MKIIKLKKWSQQNLSPLAWLRIVLALYPRMDNFSLEQLENPDDELKFSKDELMIVHETVVKIYGVSFLKPSQKRLS